jgi:molybdopterin/thiamine biosynthesis adenylyltransferase
MKSELDPLYLQRTKRNQFWIGGVESQAIISQMKVGIAGLGGMGSGVALALARLGVRSFNLADPDIIEATNLNRQVIAFENTIGVSKVKATVDQLKQVDSSISVTAFEKGISEESIDEFCHNIDVIIDEIDVYPIAAHQTLHRVALERKLDLYSAYVIGLGIHFYRFSGPEYTLEHFLRPLFDSSDFTAGLMRTYLRPSPTYLNENDTDQYQAEVESGCVPIFGPSCLLGHSMIAMRVVLDWLEKKQVKMPLDYSPTPIMPKFIVVDPITPKISVHDLG